MPVAKTRPSRIAVVHPHNTDQEVSDSAPGVALGMVPDRRIAQEYISRDIEGVKDMNVLHKAFLMGMNVLLYGPTGPGKTTMVMAYAAKQNKRFYSVASNVALDPSQMFGKMGIKEDGTYGWFDGGVTDIVRHGGVLLVNEVNFMSTRVAPVMYELFDGRREITLLDHKGEKVRAHRQNGCWCDLSADECRERWILIVADMNPGYAGTVQINSAFRNRFPIQIEIDYNDAVEEKLVGSTTLRKIVQGIRKQMGRTIETPVSTNMMMEFERLAREKDFGVKWAVYNFINHFEIEEKAAVKAAFDAQINDLLEDFKPEPEGAQEWNQFEGNNSNWIEDDEDSAGSEDSDWENDLNKAWRGN